MGWRERYQAYGTEERPRERSSAARPVAETSSA